MATDDPNKAAEDKPEAGAKPARRKPPTLDLSAREVPPEAPPQEPAPVSDDLATNEVASGPVAPDAPKMDAPRTAAPESGGPDAAPPRDEVPVLDATPEASGTTNEPATDARPDEPPEPVHPVSPPAEPRPARTLGLFGTLLVALLSGVIGAGFALAVVSAFSSAEQNIDAITELEARALDLRQRVEVLEARSGDAAAAPSAGLAAPAELATRLDALESGLDALGRKVDTLPATPSGGGAAASPDEVAAVKGQVEALEQRVAAIPPPPPPPPAAASPADLDAANARLTALEDKLGAATAAQRESGQGAAQLVVLGTLREAVAAGRPFATELKAAQSLLGGEGAPLAALESSAAEGFASGPALAARLREVTAPAPATGAAPEAAADEGFVARLLHGAQKLVTIRRSEDAAASPDLAKAEAALAQGDFDGGRAAIAALPEAERSAAQPVLAVLDARQSALATIAELDRRVLATLAGGAQ
ncbi:hypothetical protein KHC23_18055 [Ancylobacter dichloromethanicus]|uniref:Mitochondrial inner membrane protein n=1 Tax=Ancylobacter dichloromethanicus TaxID=518825 RepID=A0A9W6J4M1_9HYPH|nr:hypothetical protein [Ancylobacter dichloromethanicus]MBS7555542.1 hypothetical protein [Ancylobacter dichloromethanicus]GLK70741.1 hypothetical protein GCM10017643_08560 [Ancylobacter dichloromethanicus]